MSASSPRATAVGVSAHFTTKKTPSFSVDTQTQLFYCFGCHKGGTVIQFVMEMERLDFQEAVKTAGRTRAFAASGRFEGKRLSAPGRARANLRGKRYRGALFPRYIVD